MRKIFALVLGLLVGAPALAQQAIPAPPVSYSGNTQNWYTINNGGQYLATTSFNAYCKVKGLNCTSGDQTTNLQNYLLAAQILRYQMVSPLRTYDTTPASASQFVMAVIEPGPIRKITSPIVFPEWVDTDDIGALYRDASGSNTCQSIRFWDGTSCNALTNLYQPMVTGTMNMAVETSNLQAKDAAGANKGSGFALRTWEIGAITSVGGNLTGYTNGEAVTIANPSNFGGSNPTGTAVVVAGNLTGVTLTAGSTRFAATNGAYTLPPILQDQQYSNAAFIAATGYTTFINDGSPVGCYRVTAPGSGANGACVRVQWWPDWTNGAAGGTGDGQWVAGNAGNTTYEGTFNSTNTATNGYVNNMTVYDAGIQNDNTQFGPMFGTMFNLKNFQTKGQILTLGGYIGMQSNSIDGRFEDWNPLQMPIGFQQRAGQQHWDKMIVDSPSVGCGKIGGQQAATQGGLSTSYGIMECFVNGGQAAITGTALDASTLTSASQTILGLAMPAAVFDNLGAANPLISADRWAGGNYINAIVPNRGTTGAIITNKSCVLINFGANMYAGAGNLLTGVIDGCDGTQGPLYTGTIPQGTMFNVADAAENGFLHGPGTYEIWGAGAPTNGAAGTGFGKAIAGSIYTDTTNGNRYINQNTAASPTYAKFATNLQDIQTFTGTGTWTKPAFCSATLCTSTITVIGAGGSGGGGAMETAGTVGSGGGGGGAAECVVVQTATADLTSTVTATVAAVPTGGLGATVNGPGADGAQGASSTFGAYITAYGGGRGGGGQTAASSGGGGGGTINTLGGNATGTTAGANTGSFGAGGGSGANGGGGLGGGQFRTGAGGGGSSVTAVFTGGASLCAAAGGSGGTLLAGSAIAGGNGGLIAGLVSGTTAQGGTVGGGTGGASIPYGTLSFGLGATGSGGGGGNFSGAGGPGGGAGTATYGFGGGGGGAGTTKGGNGGVGGAGYIAVVTTGQ